MKKHLFFFVCVLLFQNFFLGQTPGTGTSPCSALQLYPQTTCGNSSGAQYAGYFQTENAGGANVNMTGTSTIDPTCTPDNETTQAVEWLAVTATATSFTITNQTDYGNSPSLTAQEPHDFVVYTGPCSSLTQIQCFTNVAGGASVTVTGLTVGQTYYIMVSQSSSAYTACNTCTAASTCITSSVPFTPSNNGCSTPFNMTTNVQYTSTNANATADGPSVCQNPATGSVENNVWYQWCAPSNWPAGQLAYLIVNNQVCNSTQGLQLSIYAPGVTCTNILAGTATSLQCQNPGSTTNYNYSFTANPNQCYLITLDGFAGVACTYNIMVSGSLCALPVLTASAANPTICSGNSTSLSASCTSNCTGINYSWAPSTGLSSTTGASVTASPTVTTTYTVSGSIGANCVGTQTVTVTVNSLPSMTSVSTATICSGNSINLNLTSNNPSTYSWLTSNNTNTTGESTSAQTGSIISNTIVSTATTSTSLIYTVTPTSNPGGCPGTPQTVTVTVNPLPIMTSATSASVCSGVPLNIGLTSNITSTYSWVANNNANTTGESTAATTGNTINNTITNTTTTSQTVVYTVTPTSSPTGCPGTPQTVSITVNPVPVMTSANTATVCSGGAVNIALSSNIASSYSWLAGDNTSTTGESLTNQTTTTINNTLTNNSSTAQSVVYTVTPTATSGSCPGSPQTVTVTVNPIPAMTSSNTATVCSGVALNIVLTSNINSSYSWVAGANANVSGESTTAQSTSNINNTLTNTTATSQTVTYTVTPTSTAGSCPGTPQTVSVTVNPLPSMTSSNTASVCSGTALNIGLTSNTTSTYSWIAGANTNVGGESTTAQSTSTINNTLSNTTSIAETVVYTVTPTSSPAGCPGTPQTVTVTVNPVPTMTSPNTATVCSGAAVNIPLNSNVASSYSWIAGDNTNTNGESLTNQGTNSINNTLTNSSSSVQTVVYTVTPTSSAGFCPGIPQTVTVTVNPLPVMTSVNTSSICSGSALNIALTSNVNSTYSWIAGANANVGGESTTAQSTSTINNTLTNTTASSQTVSYTVTPTSVPGSCPGTPQPVNITVNPLPNANAGSNQTLTCGSPTVTLNGSSTSSPVSYTWTGPGITAGANTTSASANASGTYTLTVTNTLTGCSSTSTVSVSASAGVPNISMGSSPTITCTNSVVTVTGSSTTSGVTYAWSSGVASTTSATTTVNAPGTYILTVTDPGNGCTNSGTIVVATSTVLPNVSAGTNQTITCATQTVTLSGSSTTSGVNYSWSPGGSAPNAALTNVTASGTYTLTVTNPANGCVNAATVLVNTNTVLPNVSTAPSQSLTCNVSNVTLSGSSNTSGVTYQWSPGGSSPNTASTNVSASGTYTLTVTDPSNGCTSQSTILVGSNTVQPNISAGPSQSITCTNQTVTLSGSSTTNGVSYLWNPGGSTPSAASTNVTSSGIYTLTATDPANGCTNSSSVNVTVNNTLPNLSIGNNQTLTCTNQTVTITGTSTTSGATYLWSPGGTSPNSASTNVTAAGTYTLTVTDPSNGCTTQGSVLVSSTTALPNISMGGNQTLSCTSSSATINGSSSTAGVTYQWNPGGTTPSSSSTSVSTAGIYTLTVTDPTTGCSSQGTLTVSANTNLPNVSAGSNQTITCSTQTVTLLGSSSTNGVSFLWSPGGSSSNASSTSVSTAGTYTLTATDPSNGCSSQSTVVVNTNTAVPNVSAGNDQLLTCSQTNVTLSGSSSTLGATFNWEGPNPGTPAGLTPNATSTQVSATGTYTLTVTDPSNGCTSSDIVLVNPDANLPNVTVGSNQTINCNISSVTLNGNSSTNGILFAWSGSNGGGTSPNTNTTNVNYNGTFTLTVTDTSNGCSSSATVFVGIDTISPTISITTPDTIDCSNSQIILSATTGATSPLLNWNGTSVVSGGSSLTPVVSSGGSYSLSVTDNSNGCSSTLSIVVFENFTLPSVSAGSDQNLTCTTSSLSLTGSSTTPGASFSWTGPGILSGANNSTATVGVVGEYILTVTNPTNGCSLTDTVNVIPDANLPGVFAGNDQYISCLNTNISLIGTSTNPNVSFQWSGPGGFSASGNTTSTSTVGNYTLTVTDLSNNCSNADVVLVNDSTQAPGANAGSDITLTCASPTAVLNASSGVNGVSFTWSGPAGFGANGQSTNVSSAGSYTVIVTNLNTGCISIDSVNVFSGSGIPDANAGNTQTIDCNNSVITLNGTSTTPGVLFSWSGPNGFTSLTATPLTADSGLYTLTVTDPANGCVATATVLIAQNTATPIPSISVSDTNLTCLILNTSLTGSASPNSCILSWNGPSGVVSGNPITANQAGTYSLTATDPSNGCASVINFIVGIDTTSPNLSISVSNDTLNCINPNASFSVSSTNIAVSYQWAGPLGFSSNQQNPPQVNTAGTYSVVVTDPNNGCASSSQIVIVQGNDPTVSFTATPSSGVAPLPVNFSNSSTAGFSGFIWSFGDTNTSSDPNPSNTYNSTGTFTVTLIGTTPNNACNDTASLTIIVYPEAEIIIPNIFSPNGDGTNEFFFITSTGLKELQVDIYDRWGLKVGEINGPNGYWDGTNSSEGTYFYILNATGFDNKTIQKQGYLMLVK